MPAANGDARTGCVFPCRVMMASFLEDLQLDVAGELFVGAIITYLSLVAVGRLLKRKFGAKLGVVYQLFALILGPYLAMVVLHIAPPGRRELGAAAALLGSGVLGRFIDQFFWRWYFERHRRAFIPKFIRELTAGVLLLGAGLLVLEFGYGVQIPGLLAASGVVGIILGFALQDSLGNIIAGFALQFGRPFTVGDWLLIDGKHVQAVEINWRSTRFITNDEVQLDVPNQHIVRQTLVNYHGGDSRHAMRLDVGIDYDVPPNSVKDLLTRAAASADGVLSQPAPSVFLKDFGDSAVIYEVRFWLDDHRLYNATADAVRTNIWYALHRQRIRIPYPIRHVEIERSRKPLRDQHLSREEQRAKATRELLRAQPLFQSVNDDNLKLLVTLSTAHHYGRGETIIREGAEGASMFVLIKGEATVSVMQGGQPTQVAVLHDGDCFGEMSLLTGEKRSASIVAVSDCEVIEVTKPVFAEIFSRDSELLPRLSELLASRQMQTEGIVQAAVQQPAVFAAKEEEYRAGFLHKLKSFFEL